MVGSAIKRAFKRYNKPPNKSNLLCPSSSDLNLLDKLAVKNWFVQNNPSIVILAAAKVGGIQANNQRPGEFILENLKIQNNVILNFLIDKYLVNRFITKKFQSKNVKVQLQAAPRRSHLGLSAERGGDLHFVKPTSFDKKDRTPVNQRRLAERRRQTSKRTTRLDDLHPILVSHARLSACVRFPV